MVLNSRYSHPFIYLVLLFVLGILEFVNSCKKIVTIAWTPRRIPESRGITVDKCYFVLVLNCLNLRFPLYRIISTCYEMRKHCKVCYSWVMFLIVNIFCSTSLCFTFSTVETDSVPLNRTQEQTSRQGKISLRRKRQGRQKN